MVSLITHKHLQFDFVGDEGDDDELDNVEEKKEAENQDLGGEGDVFVAQDFADEAAQEEEVAAANIAELASVWLKLHPAAAEKFNITSIRIERNRENVYVGSLACAVCGKRYTLCSAASVDEMTSPGFSISNWTSILRHLNNPHLCKSKEVRDPEVRPRVDDNSSSTWIAQFKAQFEQPACTRTFRDFVFVDPSHAREAGEQRMRTRCKAYATIFYGARDVRDALRFDEKKGVFSLCRDLARAPEHCARILAETRKTFRNLKNDETRERAESTQNADARNVLVCFKWLARDLEPDSATVAAIDNAMREVVSASGLHKKNLEGTHWTFRRERADESAQFFLQLHRLVYTKSLDLGGFVFQSCAFLERILAQNFRLQFETDQVLRKFVCFELMSEKMVNLVATTAALSASVSLTPVRGQAMCSTTCFFVLAGSGYTEQVFSHDFVSSVILQQCGDFSLLFNKDKAQGWAKGPINVPFGKFSFPVFVLLLCQRLCVLTLLEVSAAQRDLLFLQPACFKTNGAWDFQKGGVRVGNEKRLFFSDILKPFLEENGLTLPAFITKFSLLRPYGEGCCAFFVYVKGLIILLQSCRTGWRETMWMSPAQVFPHRATLEQP